MDKSQRLHLQKMLDANNVQDKTPMIKKLKHSKLILDDVNKLIELKKKYARLNNLSDICFKQCNFLSTNYTDIYNKLYKDELNINILYKFIEQLRLIEEGIQDQHEASYNIGKLLKELYIDSALKKADKLTSKEKVITYRKGKNISWTTFKNREKNKIDINI